MKPSQAVEEPKNQTEDLMLNPSIFGTSCLELKCWPAKGRHSASKTKCRFSSRGERQLKRWNDDSVDHENQAKQGINVVFKELIYKLLAQIRDKPYFKKPKPLGGNPKKRNQWCKCSFQEEKGHKIENCRALKTFLDQLVRHGQEKDQGRGSEAKPNPRFDQSNEKMDDTLEELPLEIIH